MNKNTIYCPRCTAKLEDMNDNWYQCSNDECNEMFYFELLENGNSRVTHIKTPFTKDIKPNVKQKVKLTAAQIESAHLVTLTLEVEVIRNTKNILITIFTNASGYLYNMNKVDSGTDLGYSEYTGNCKNSGTFTTYNRALEAAIKIVYTCDLEQFQAEIPDDKFHWSNYCLHVHHKLKAKLKTNDNS